MHLKKENNTTKGNNKCVKTQKTDNRVGGRGRESGSQGNSGGRAGRRLGGRGVDTVGGQELGSGAPPTGHEEPGSGDRSRGAVHGDDGCRSRGSGQCRGQALGSRYRRIRGRSRLHLFHHSCTHMDKVLHFFFVPT